MKSVDVYYAKNTKKLSSEQMNRYLTILPSNLQERNQKFVRWEDQQANLYGKLLLIKALKKFNLDEQILYRLKYNDYSRPYIDEDVDFNISHSGEYVVCAVAGDMRIGIDIEHIREIDFKYFKRVMTETQWDDILGSQDEMKTFFKYWALKESVIKADSRGLSVPLEKLEVNNGVVVCDGISWHTNSIFIAEGYSTCLATDEKRVKVNLFPVEINDYSFSKL